MSTVTLNSVYQLVIQNDSKTQSSLSTIQTNLANNYYTKKSTVDIIRTFLNEFTYTKTQMTTILKGYVNDQVAETRYVKKSDVPALNDLGTIQTKVANVEQDIANNVKTKIDEIVTTFLGSTTVITGTSPYAGSKGILYRVKDLEAAFAVAGISTIGSDVTTLKTSVNTLNTLVTAPNPFGQYVLSSSPTYSQLVELLTSSDDSKRAATVSGVNTLISSDISAFQLTINTLLAAKADATALAGKVDASGLNALVDTHLKTLGILTGTGVYDDKAYDASWLGAWPAAQTNKPMVALDKLVTNAFTKASAVSEAVNTALNTASDTGKLTSVAGPVQVDVLSQHLNGEVIEVATGTDLTVTFKDPTAMVIAASMINSSGVLSLTGKNVGTDYFANTKVIRASAHVAITNTDATNPITIIVDAGTSAKIVQSNGGGTTQTITVGPNGIALIDVNATFVNDSTAIATTAARTTVSFDTV